MKEMYLDKLNVKQLLSLLPCQSAATEIAVKQRITELDCMAVELWEKQQLRNKRWEAKPLRDK